MRQSKWCQRFDVIRDDVVAALQCGAGLRGPEQRQRSARRGAQVHIGVLACARYDFDNITLDQHIDVDRSDVVLRGQQLLGGDDLTKRVDRMDALL